MKQLYHPKKKEADCFIFKVSVSAAQLIKLPLLTGYNYNFWVSYGDGTKVKVTAFNSSNATHAFANAGTYTVKIAGSCQCFAVNNSAETNSIRLAITEVVKWGTRCDFRLLNFYGCTNLSQIPHDENGATAVTGASEITTLANFLNGCSNYRQNLNERIFTQTCKVTVFDSAFALSGITGTIPSLLFKLNTLAVNFRRVFYSTAISGTLDGNLFFYNPLAQIFEETFGYTSISGNLPVSLFTWCHTNAVNFKGTFRNTNLGSAGEVLPSSVYDTNTNATDFSYNLYATKYTCNIPLLFQQNSKVITYAYTFANTPFSGVPPVDLFKTSGGSVLSFEGTFNSTNITGIPDRLFWYNVNATTWHGCFALCYYLTRSNAGLGYDIFNNVLFSQNTNARKFSQLFWDDYNIQMPLPEDMFWANTQIDDMWGAFAKVAIEGNVPRRFHWYMPKLKSLSYTYYQGGWANYTMNGEIDPDLFIFNPELTDVSWIFRWRHGISKVPNGLFRNNKKINSFLRAFNSDVYEVQRYVFSESNDASAYQRFQGIAPSFGQCFNGGGSGYINLSVAPASAWIAGDLITGQSSGATCRVISRINNTQYYIHSLSGSFQYTETIGVTGDPARLATQTGNFPTFSGPVNCRYAQDLWDPSRYDIYSSYAETRQRPSTLWKTGDVIKGMSSGATFTMVTDMVSTAWTFYIKELTGTFQNGEIMGVEGDPTRQITINAAYLWFYFAGRVLNLNAAPATDWTRDDIITGQSSGATCRIQAKISSTSYYIRNVQGTFQDGEVIGVTGNSGKLADQGAGAPYFTYSADHSLCFGGGAAQYSNYQQIPADWK